MIKDFLKGKKSIAVVGLGYVGLPLALAFSKFFSVTGFDIKKERVEELSRGFDKTGETSKKELSAANITFTSDPSALKKASGCLPGQ